MSKKNRIVVADLREGRVPLDRQEAHYATRVHRMRDGEECVVFDPWRVKEAPARLVIEGASISVEIGPVLDGQHMGWPGLELCQALGKGDKTERVLRDAVALGASQVTFVHTERSVPRRADKSERTEVRWQSVLLDTARQCGRSNLPCVSGPLSFETAVGRVRAGCDVVLHPGDGTVPLLAAVEQLLAAAPRGFDADHPLRLWVGPEGGFDDAELTRLDEIGALRADLGPLVLRTELAASVALACVGARLRQREEDRGAPPTMAN